MLKSVKRHIAEKFNSTYSITVSIDDLHERSYNSITIQNNNKIREYFFAKDIQNKLFNYFNYELGNSTDECKMHIMNSIIYAISVNHTTIIYSNKVLLGSFGYKMH